MWTPVGGGAVGSNTPNGYVRLSNGLILQWCIGTASTSEGQKYVSFPIIFPSAILHVSVSTKISVASGGMDAMFQVISYNTSGVFIQHQTMNSNGNLTPFIIAIGY